jgi:hypothetical protein
MRQHLFIALIIILPGFSGSLIHGQQTTLDLYYSGEYRKVLEQTSAGIESSDTTFTTFYLQVLSQAQLGQTAQAINTLELALQRFPGDSRFVRMLAGQQFGTKG